VVREKTLEPGTRAVPIDVLVDGVVYQTIWSNWRVKLWKTMPVLARDVRRGEALVPACFEERRVEVGGGTSDGPLALDLVLGALPLRDLASGSPVTERDIERPRVLARGDLVHLEVHSGSIHASTLVVAQQDGHVGERIRVIQPDTGKEMVALVRSAELVEIRMGSRTN
jgi:flagella basal body P-ring formation protein FlgA